MFDQTLIRVCLILGSFITAGYILRRVRHAKVQIEDTIFWLMFSAALLILAIFPGIAGVSAWVPEPHQFCLYRHHLFAAGQAVLYVHQIEPARQQGPYPDRAGRPERGKSGAG